jgi:hypothetical protein
MISSDAPDMNTCSAQMRLPVLIAGDFNTSPKDSVYAYIQSKGIISTISITMSGYIMYIRI